MNLGVKKDGETGVFGMILEQIPFVLMLHLLISIVVVFFLAIHIFVFHKKSNHNWDNCIASA